MTAPARKRYAKHEPIAAPVDSQCHYDGHYWRRTARGVCRWTPGTNPRGGSWTRMSPWTLRRYPADSALWEWLRSIGVERQQSARTPESESARRVLSVRVSEEARQALDALVLRWGCDRGQAVERALLGASRGQVEAQSS